jgi:hypothetical protein
MTVKQALWSLRRSLGLSPTQYIFRELRRRGVTLNDLSALEVFGGTGGLHTQDYAAQVRRLELWEINPDHEGIAALSSPTRWFASPTRTRRCGAPRGSTACSWSITRKEPMETTLRTSTFFPPFCGW